MMFSKPDRAMSYSPASPLSVEGSKLHPSTSLHSDDDIKQALEAISTLSFSFDSLTSSFSVSPLMEQRTSGEGFNYLFVIIISSILPLIELTSLNWLLM